MNRTASAVRLCRCDHNTYSTVYCCRALRAIFEYKFHSFLSASAPNPIELFPVCDAILSFVTSKSDATNVNGNARIINKFACDSNGIGGKSNSLWLIFAASAESNRYFGRVLVQSLTYRKSYLQDALTGNNLWFNFNRYSRLQMFFFSMNWNWITHSLLFCKIDGINTSNANGSTNCCDNLFKSNQIIHFKWTLMSM